MGRLRLSTAPQEPSAFSIILSTSFSNCWLLRQRRSSRQWRWVASLAS